MEVKLKFQDKFYDIFDHNKCLPSETEDEKCIFRKSYFHRIQPNYGAWADITSLCAIATNQLNINSYKIYCSQTDMITIEL